MPWIKKNLLFVISCAVALVLLVIAGYYAWSKSQEEEAIQGELAGATQEYQNLNTASPFPDAENIAAVKKEQQRIKDFRKELGKMFVPPQAIPKLDDQKFKAYLENTIADLTAAAAAENVALPPKYSFTFSAQRARLNFAPGSIDPWMVQLSDIRTLCGILYDAKINALDNLQRAPVVSQYDAGSGEFLNSSIITNQMGVFRPYLISFRSFSSEIASVIESMAKSTNCIIVKSINVVPSTVPLPGAPDPNAPQQTYAPARAYYPAPAALPPPRSDDAARYGERPSYRAQPVQQPQQVRPAARAVAAQPAATTILSEKPLQVTLLVEVVQLNQPQ